MDASQQEPSPPPREKWYHVLWRIGRWPVILYLLIALLMALFEERLIFFPSPYPVGDWNPTWLAHEEAWFQSADGTRLHGWYVPHERPRAHILFCHGNAGNLSHRAELLGALRQVDAAVLIFDYRGYGRSSGSPSEKGILADARAARAWLAERAGLHETDLVMMGESLGGAVAVELAGRDGARGLVVQSSFSSLPDVAAYHYPWLPVSWLMRTRLDAAQAIRGYHGPLLQSHAEADTIVPFVFGERLFAAAHEPKTLFKLGERDHNDPPPPAYWTALARFLDQLPPIESPPRRER